MNACLRAENLEARYGERIAVRGANLEARPGEVTALLGPNGAGKSTLLKALAGLVEHRGEVFLGEVSLRSMSRKEIARRVALVAQDPPGDVPFTAAEVVLMGRAPHLGRWALEAAPDRAIAEEAMREADVLSLAARPIDQLSGGERRRVFLARALAQQPQVLLLDEPTAFLDLAHQASILAKAHARARAGLCVLAVLHDPNLAATFADRVILMRDGQIVAQGPANELLTVGKLEALYGTPLVAAARGSGAVLFGHPGPA